MYSYDPLSGVPEENQHLVLGGEAHVRPPFLLFPYLNFFLVTLSTTLMSVLG